MEKRLEKIQRLLGNLATEVLRGIPVIVEGEKDATTLNNLGVSGSIILAKSSGKGLLDVLREVEGRGSDEVILLLDFDRRGREWTQRLAHGFETARIKPNLVYWKELSGIVGRDVKDIEGLSTYIQNLKSRIGKDMPLLS